MAARSARGQPPPGRGYVGGPGRGRSAGVVFGLLWVPELNGVFWEAIDALLRALGVSEGETYLGLEYFRFWRGEPAGTPLPG